jgi:hypothetical protein
MCSSAGRTPDRLKHCLLLVDMFRPQLVAVGVLHFIFSGECLEAQIGAADVLEPGVGI